MSSPMGPSLAGPVLVTGASGFIGRHACAGFAALGVPVHAVARRGSARRPIHDPGVTVHTLGDATAEIGALVESVQPAVVVHLATMFAARHEPASIARMAEANVAFATAVADASTRQSARLVHATSAWQHYAGSEFSPVSLYAATKQAFVDIVQYFVEVEGLDAAEVCLFDTYGPRDDRRKLVWLLLEHAFTGRPLPMSSGLQLVDLTHVSDVVRALVMVAGDRSLTGRFVARSGSPITIRTLVDRVETVTGRPIDVQWGEQADRPREMVEDWRVTGTPWPWRPQVDLRDGIAGLWAERAADG